MQDREIIYCACAALAASSPGPVHFGLCAEACALAVEITWQSGIVQKLESVNADRIVMVTEAAPKNQQGKLLRSRCLLLLRFKLLHNTRAQIQNT
jgi:hypothetical protein